MERACSVKSNSQNMFPFFGLSHAVQKKSRPLFLTMRRTRRAVASSTPGGAGRKSARSTRIVQKIIDQRTGAWKSGLRPPAINDMGAYSGSLSILVRTSATRYLPYSSISRRAEAALRHQVSGSTEPVTTA